MIEELFAEAAKIDFPATPRRVWRPEINNNRKRRKRITDALSKERYEAGWWDKLGKGYNFPSGMSPVGLSFTAWERPHVTSVLSGINTLSFISPVAPPVYPQTPTRNQRFSEEEHKALARVEKLCHDNEFMRNGRERTDRNFPFILRRFLEMFPEGFPFPTVVLEKDGEPEAQWDSEDWRQVWVYFGHEAVYIQITGFYYKDGNPVKCNHWYSMKDGVAKVVSLIERLKKEKGILKPFTP